jgi:hypothetical protein
MPRVITALAFAVATALVATAALLVFGSPVKESRAFFVTLILVPSITAAIGSALAVQTKKATGYDFGFFRGALVGALALAVFTSTMAGLACEANAWLSCVEKTLAAFGFVMGVPLILVSGMVALLLTEIHGT